MANFKVPHYNTNYAETWYQISQGNHDWHGFSEIRETVDWVPGGKKYHLLIDKPAPDPSTINTPEKIWQQYGNSDRWEWCIQQIYREFFWTSHYTGGFNGGIGADEADLKGTNGLYLDAKVYITEDSMFKYIIDLFTNKKGLNQKEWKKAVYKLYHKNNFRLLAYDNNKQKGYFIFKPERVLTLQEALARIVPAVDNNGEDVFFPNVIATQNGYELDWNNKFTLNFINNF